MTAEGILIYLNGESKFRMEGQRGNEKNRPKHKYPKNEKVKK